VVWNHNAAAIFRVFPFGDLEQNHLVQGRYKALLYGNVADLWGRKSYTEGNLLPFRLSGRCIGFNGEGISVGNHALNVKFGGFLNVRQSLLFRLTPRMATRQRGHPGMEVRRRAKESLFFEAQGSAAPPNGLSHILRRQAPGPRQALPRRKMSQRIKASGTAPSVKRSHNRSKDHLLPTWDSNRATSFFEITHYNPTSTRAKTTTFCRSGTQNGPPG